MSMRVGLLALALASIAAACGPGAEAACNVDGARYALRGSPAFTASFRQVPGSRSAHDLIFDVRSAKTGRTFSFRINRGNGYGEATLSPTRGGMSGQVELYTLNDAAEFTDYFGEVEGPAPRQLLAPKLGPVLWYQADALTGASNSARERMPRAFFDRVSCGPAAR
ncbi:MAG TPA: hypothetical protein PLO65_11280 [Caulobacter sp.]|nr:hypothetical protein [Caulobacter sp.]